VSSSYSKEDEWRGWDWDGVQKGLRDAKNIGGGGGEALASVELGGSHRAVQVGGNEGLVGRRRGHHCRQTPPHS
jgi:hypothetical protein